MILDDLVVAGLVERNRPLGAMTTYKFGGPAAWFAEVGTMTDLKRVLDAAGATPGEPPLFVLGRGSNVVVADAGYPGVVIRLGGEFNQASFAGDTVTAGAGVSLPRLARFCAAEGRGGLEFYVGIPGSVGGAVVMNAGGHGSDTAEWLLDASVLHTLHGRTSTEDAQSLELSYRHSNLGPWHVVLSARFRTVARTREESETLMREITAWRREKQPGGTYNAGSAFKNPPGDAAGRIIDAAGLKGFRIGGVSVSDRHANFFVASDEATAQDVYDLVHAVRDSVLEQVGVMLEPEIRFVGDFGRTS